MSEPRILTDLELANAQIDRERTPVLVRDLAYTAEVTREKLRLAIQVMEGKSVSLALLDDLRSVLP